VQLSSEVKVGILFFIGLGLLTWFTLFVTNIGTPNGEYAVRFPRVSKLKEGDAVTYNGVRVGMVTEVAPILGEDGAPAVKIVFTLDTTRKDMVLIDDQSRFMITQGLLGGSAMDISSRSGRPISPENLRVHMGEDPVGIDEVMASVRNLIEENRSGIKEAISTAKTSLDSFGKMSDEIKGLVAENRLEVKNAVANFSTMSARIAKLVEDNSQAIAKAITRFEEMSQQIRDVVAENRESIKKAADKLPAAVDNVASAAKTIDDTVTENRPDLKRAVTSIAKTGENLGVITTQIASGQGTIGKLVFDDELHDKTILAVDNFNDRLEEVKPVTSGFSDFKIFLGAHGGANIDTGSATYGAYIRFEPRPWKFYEGGISYRTEPDDRAVQKEDPDKFHFDFNLLFGWRFFADDANQRYRLTLALGMIESNLGGYVEAPIIGELSLRVMGRVKDSERDPTDRRYEDGDALVRATVGYRLWQRVYVQAGVDDVIDNPGFWGGLRVELLDNDLRNVTAVTSLGGF
jgi:phospholipid/cholesterol/gamma-HCH transport system substrate-binding protein